MKVLNPKSQFQKAVDPNFLIAIVDDQKFQQALAFALAEMQMNMSMGENPSQAWDRHCQMMGARKFIETLLNLAEPPSAPSRITSSTLKPERPFVPTRKETTKKE